MLDFCLEVTLNGRKDLKPPLLIGCSHLCLSWNQIAGIFDHQYMNKKSNKTINYLYGDNHQKSKDLRGAVLVGRCQLCLPSNQTERYFDQEYLWNELINNQIFCIEMRIRGRKDLSTSFGFFESNQIDGFFDHLYHLWKESITILDFLQRENH